jgi:glycosyltransferase involved in cell wall biosynthesis
LSPFFSRVCIERHSFSKKTNIIEKFVFRTVRGVVVLTSFIKEKIVGLGVSASRVFVAPDAVRLTDFEEKLSIQSARSALNIFHTGYIIGYIGTLKTMGQEKGVSTAIESLSTLPEDYMLYVVGGEKKDVEFYTLYARQCGLEHRVVFVGKVPHKEIPVYAQGCNLLVAPFPDVEHYRYFMSPLKIFEYMASRRPMVVTDLPSLREVLVPDETAVFVPPSDPRALADAVVALTTDTERAECIAENAYREVVEKYTWKKRAENILKFIQS